MLVHFQNFVTAVEQFTAKIEAKSLEIPNELAEMKNLVSEEAYRMQSWAWQSEQFAYLRLTHLSSLKKVEMFNFAIYPHSVYDVPVFASDFVMVGNALRVAVIDAMPLFPDSPEYENSFIQPFASLYEQSFSLGVPYERNLDWSFHFMSKHACLRQNIPLDDLDNLQSLWEGYLELYLKLAHEAQKINPTQETEILNWHQQYNQEHLEVERKRNPLMHYFGKELGTKYLEEFLFRSL